MNITAFFLLFAFTTASAASFGQRITLSEKNAPLEKVLKAIRIQSGYDLVGNTKQIKNGKVVSIHVNNVSLDEALRICFNNQELTYKVNEKTISVRARETSLLDRVIGVFTAKDLSGKVLGPNNEPLAGTSVKIKKTGIATLTDNMGMFHLKNVDENAVLVISFLGYITKEVAVSDNLGQIRLELSTSKLDEVQVQGYGITSKRLSTGNISKVQSSVITQQPVSNVLQAIQGRVPGLYISQSSGIAGSGVNVSIRGRNSINAGNNPLYIVDGVPFSNTTVSSQAEGVVLQDGASGANFSPFNTINPDDIESVEILKDADATSIYGARAANGVILITTKKGKIGKTNFDVNFSQGIGKVTGTAEVLNTSEYLKLRNRAFINDEIDKTDAEAPDLLLWDQNANTNWQKLLIGNTAQTTNFVASLSGGNEDTRYKLTGSFRRETTVYQDDKSYKRGAVHATVDHTSPNKKLNVGFSMIYTKDSNTLPTVDLSNLYNLPPNYPLYAPSGQLYFGGGFTNPLAYLLSTNYNDTENAILNGTAKYNIIKGLDVKVSAGYNKITLNMEGNHPSTSQDPSTAANIYSIFSLANTTTYIVEPQLDYRIAIGKGSLAATLGGTWQNSQFDQPYTLLVTGYTSDALMRNPSSGNIGYKLSYFSEYKYLSAFARLNYNWDGKYLLSATFRRDGSSKFGPNNRFGNFGSIGAGWIFSQEKSISEGLPFLSHGKLRGSYGSVGNDQINSNYAYKDTYRSSSYTYGGSNGLVINGLANRDYRWEVTKKAEIALELGFLKDRILFTTAAYKNKSDNMLVEYALSPQTGFASYTANLPAVVENSGLEFELNTRNVAGKEFSWSTDFNISFQKNKLARYDNINSSAYANTYVVGKSLDLISLYKFTGVVDGIPTVEDLNKDGSLSTGFSENGNGDYMIAGQTTPIFFGGLNNSFRYKQFQLDVFFQFVKQQGYKLGYGNTDYYPGSLNNIPSYIANQGIKPTMTSGTDAANGFEYYVDSDAMVTDASFIRLKNLSFSYSLPDKLLRNLKVNSCRVYLRGQNLLTITNYKGLDPETQGSVLPPLKMLTAGLQFNF